MTTTEPAAEAALDAALREALGWVPELLTHPSLPGRTLNAWRLPDSRICFYTPAWSSETGLALGPHPHALADAMRERGWLLELDDRSTATQRGWSAHFTQGAPPEHHCYAPTPAEAISRAALAALTGEQP